jgi:hypothetical protein
MAAYVLATQKPRKPKRIYKNLDTYYSRLQNVYLKNLEKHQTKIKRKH